MKHVEIQTGKSYYMKVSGNIVPVIVERIRERYDLITGHIKGHTYTCVNVRTGRICQARSAAKFRGEVVK